MVHGTAWFRIKDPNLFVNEVVGGQGAYNTGQVDDFIRGFINERVIDVMSKYDLTTAFTQLDKASTDVKVNINDALNRLGTDLVDFKFEGIDTSDQFRDRLFWIKQRAATSDVLRMETAKDIGASLGASRGCRPRCWNGSHSPSNGCANATAHDATATTGRLCLVSEVRQPGPTGSKILPELR